jgi:hypothetical protein
MVTLTPQARAVAAFTLSVLLVTGSLNRITYTVIGIFGDAFPQGRSGGFLAGLIATVVGIGVLALAMSAANQVSAGWEQSLAQAARVLAVIGLAIVVVTTFNSVVHDGVYGFPGSAFFSG